MILSGKKRSTQEKNVSQNDFVHHKSTWVGMGSLQLSMVRVQ
jgi:hypothetical protein